METHNTIETFRFEPVSFSQLRKAKKMRFKGVASLPIMIGSLCLLELMNRSSSPILKGLSFLANLGYCFGFFLLVFLVWSSYTFIIAQALKLKLNDKAMGKFVLIHLLCVLPCIASLPFIAWGFKALLFYRYGIPLPL